MALALVLFSGGIDSTTTFAIAIHSGFQPIALSFDYGQRHRLELEKGKRVLEQFSNTPQITLAIDLTQIGGSALTSDIEVPKLRAIEGEIPPTYVPGRNLIFLSLAAAVSEVHGISDIFFGANILDYSGYPDCRPEFIESLERTINLGTKAGSEKKSFRIHAPLLRMTKSEIIRKGIELGVDYTHTHSCYDPTPEGESCGTCDSCQLRLKGFHEAGIKDPAAYSGVSHE
jgi:7-cyano-7-deazaguanine synthase